MADSYHIIDGTVVPYSGGRKCNDTDAWRDATPLELQLQEQLAEYEHATAAKDAEIEALRNLCGAAYQLAGVHDAPEVWLDALSAAASGHPFSTDGLLPYMPQAVCEAEARAERLAEALRKLEEREQSDEALLQQALEALERGAWDTLSGRNAAFAIRERLGLGQENGDA